MSLACLACHVLDSSPERTLRSYSDNGGRCLGLGCWTRKLPNAAQIEPTVSSMSESELGSRTRSQQQVAPVPGSSSTIVVAAAAANLVEAPSSPRLTRCHAVRRDLFRDWNFEEMSRQLCMNLSGAA
ncbi:uncharacterized protein LOC112350100 [Selaginella moellendorffii]|uniref:uncharacterized protein LOC112348775 n=1 Tax=Selaginella moellendorffii TaxID=88036 RepID=UPI000D1CB539|nr:uncharacterized protein LOC112348775 [Selaginella moellendorffii]XP_024541528.1 uncharacterized protein LOC112350100 [Selaginella moellendorffii]|eukprot:XP_024537747.1 uncharacterized protein LOC112348775 [Selaginella moellendorffii]